MKKYKLTENQSKELWQCYVSYIKNHKDDEDKILVPNENEMYDVTLSSCIDICKNFIRIPTEYYCGEKVYPRNIELISDYTYYEKLCVLEILKDYDSEISREIASCISNSLK